MSTTWGGSNDRLSPRARVALAVVMTVALVLLWVTHRGPVGDIPERRIPPPGDTTEAP